MQFDHTVVTIGREYGSGGREIGKKLAEKMGVAFYDKEILMRAAKESGICENLFEDYDEKADSGYLFSIAGGLGLSPDSSVRGMPLRHKIFLAQFDAITKLAAEGACVIIGRCGDYVLENKNNVIHFFLYADVGKRIQRIMQLEKLSYEQAKQLVRKTDKLRQNYYNFFADGNWGKRQNYDVMLRTEGLSVDAAADLLLYYVKQKETEGAARK